MKFLKVGLASLVLASLAMIQGSAALAVHGGNYHLFGNATPVHPGHNSDTAIQMSSVGGGFGGINFDETMVTPPATTVAALQNLSTDYMFTTGSCGLGSPRFQINVTTAPGETDNIFVYIGPPPNYTGCVEDVWQTTGDLLEAALFVDTSQLPGGTFYDTWASALIKYGSMAVTGIQLVSDNANQVVLVDNVMINGTLFTFESQVVNPNDKERCKNGGWQTITTAPGPFKNQGDCVSFFATGGKNKGSGD
jgi:hypothetical protein